MRSLTKGWKGFKLFTFGLLMACCFCLTASSDANATIKQLTNVQAQSDFTSLGLTLTAKGDVAYFISAMDLVGHNPSKYKQIYKVKLDTKELTQVSNFTASDTNLRYIDSLAVSGDGSTIAISGYGIANVINSDGSGLKQLAFHPDGVYGLGSLGISFDGNKIVFISANGGYQRAWVVNKDGSHLTVLTPNGLPYNPLIRITPDASKLFIIYGSDAQHSNCFLDVINLADLSRKTVINDPGVVPWTVSPFTSSDGKYASFLSTSNLTNGNPNHNRVLFIVDTGSLAVTQMTTPPIEYPCENTYWAAYCVPNTVRMSQDGKELFYTHVSVPTYGVWHYYLHRMNIDKSNPASTLLEGIIPSGNTSSGLTTMNGDVSVTLVVSTANLTGENPNGYTQLFAWFWPQLQVVADPSNEGSVSGPGIACGSQGNDCQENYTLNQPVTLTALEEPGYTLHYWFDGQNYTYYSTQLSLTMDSSKTVTVKYAPLPGISVSINPTGGGTVKEAAQSPRIDCPASSCSANLDYQQQITLTATPNAGYTFVKWAIAGNDYSTNATATFTITDPMNITAVFAPIPVLTVMIDPPGAGAVVSTPGGINCGNGNVACTQTITGGQASLTNTSNTGYIFDSWIDGEITSQDLAYIVSVDRPKTVVAKYRVASSRAPGYIGLFFGVKDHTENNNILLRGDLAAQNMSLAFNNLPNVVHNYLLQGDLTSGGQGIKYSQIEWAIESIKSIAQEGDTLWIYIEAQGYVIDSHSVALIGTTNISQYDPNGLLDPDNLASWLQGLDTVKKFVFMDVCFSGGLYYYEYASTVTYLQLTRIA